MKLKNVLSVLLVLVFLAGTVTPATALDDFSPEAVAADALVVRPACFVATLVGSALFLVSLPITVVSGKVGKTADALVGKPGRATFVRDMGDMSGLD